jgi:hypothetical protein
MVLVNQLYLELELPRINIKALPAPPSATMPSGTHFWGWQHF